MVAELQTDDTTAMDWQPEEPVEVPSPTLRLLARVPRVDDRFRQSRQTLPHTIHLVDRQPVSEASLDVAGNLPAQPSEDTAPRETRKLVEWVDLEDQEHAHALDWIVTADCPAEETTESLVEETSEQEEDWITWLGELHTKLAPYAGLIVTFALFTSAGLLYWLVFGPYSSAHLPQEPMGLDRIGQYSQEPNTRSTHAPVWNAPQTAPAVPGEKTSQVVPQHGSSPAPTTVGVQPTYPKTHYESYDFVSSEVGGKDPKDHHEIASRPERNRTRQQIR